MNPPAILSLSSLSRPNPVSYSRGMRPGVSSMQSEEDSAALTSLRPLWARYLPSGTVFPTVSVTRMESLMYQLFLGEPKWRFRL